jgi:hypothetical protein
LSVGKSGSFYGSIKRSNIKSFSDMNKKTKLKCRSGETVQGNINPELIFRRAALALTFRRLKEHRQMFQIEDRQNFFTSKD